MPFLKLAEAAISFRSQHHLPKPAVRRRRPTNRSFDRLEERSLLSAGLGFSTTAAGRIAPIDQGLGRSAMVGQLRAGLRAAREASATAGQQTAAVLGHLGVAKAMSDVVYNQQGGHQAKLDVYRPTGPAPAGGWPAVIAIPGGGWEWASKKDYGSAASGLARYGFVVVAVDYTFSSPGVRSWPANLNDLKQAVRWVRKHAASLGVDPNKIAAMGESAGAHLAALLGTYPDGPAVADGTPQGAASWPDGVSSRVEAVVDFYGPIDLVAEYRDSPRARPDLVSFLGGTPDQVPARYVAASPIDHIGPDTPPMFLIHGTADAIVPYQQTVAMDAALKAAGIPDEFTLLQGFTHGFRFQFGPDNLLPGIAGFLNTAFTRSTTGPTGTA
jgi:acetyl esterase/lipase